MCEPGTGRPLKKHKCTLRLSQRRNCNLEQRPFPDMDDMGT